METSNKKDMVKLLLCCTIWGAAALYWNLFPAFDLVFKVACRVVFSFVFGLICLAVTKNLKSIPEAFRDKKRIKWIALSAATIGANWLAYVWGLSNGHIIDASLANFMNPIVISVASVIIFKDKINGLQVASLAVVFVGVLYSVIAYGSFPFVGIIQTLTFAAYTFLKKKANTSGITSTTIETGLLTPLALIWVFIFCRGEGGFGSVDSFWTVLLLLSTGVYTGGTYMLYSAGINSFSALFVGLANLLSPTITLITGVLFLGEELAGPTLVSFICVIIAIILFIISMIRDARKGSAAA